MRTKVIGLLNIKGMEIIRRVYDPEFLAPTISTCGGGQREPKVMENKPRKDIKEAERYCKYCGKKIERKRFNGRLEDFGVFMKRQYCNRECMKRDYLKVGETYANWSNAHASARNINKLILKKDHCEICGSKQNLDIHHIDGNWQNNNLDNLMCLCRSCHMKEERKEKQPEGGDAANVRIRKLTPKECWRSPYGIY